MIRYDLWDMTYDTNALSCSSFAIVLVSGSLSIVVPSGVLGRW